MSAEIEAETEGRLMPLPDCGQRVSVETPRHVEKLWTQMIGYKPGAYLVLEKPPGADGVEGKQALKDGDSLVIRFLKDGSIFGFRTPVLSTVSVPYKLMFVAYPVDVVKHSLRSSPRLQCHLPCYGEVGGRAFSRAFIRDFSASGCQLRISLDDLADEEEDEAETADIEARALAEEVETHESRAHAARSYEVGAHEATSDAGPADGGPVAEAPGGEAPADDVPGDEALDEPVDPRGLTLNLQLPGEDEIRVASGEVLEWQSLARYHLLRVRFHEPQLEVFEQLTLYTTQLG